MPKSLYRTALQSLLIVLAFVALSAFMLAQEPASAVSKPTSELQTNRIEMASLDPASAPPENATAFTSTHTLPASAVSVGPMAFVSVSGQPKVPATHPFWDSKNRALFAAVGGLAAVDFYATHANLASGGKELNPVTRVFSGSTPALATNFALEAAGVVGLSYMFHRTGHHKLERITALVNIGASGAAAGYSLAHR